MTDSFDSITIACTPEEAYTFISIPQNHKRFRVSLLEFRDYPDGAADVGDTWVTVNNFMGQKLIATYTVIEAVPPSKFVYESTSVGADIRTTWKFDPVEAGTHVTYISIGDTKAILAKWPYRLVMGHYVKRIRHMLETMKAVLEG